MLRETPGTPWVEGDGQSVPLVLRWQPPSPAIVGRLQGYAVQMRIVRNDTGEWRELVGNTRSKAAKLTLPVALLDGGVEYQFRIACLEGGGQQLGLFSPPSAPLSMPYGLSTAMPRKRAGGGDHAAGSGGPAGGATLKAVRSALLEWSRSFEGKYGRPPTDADKSASSEYRSLARQYRSLTRIGEATEPSGGEAAAAGARGRRRSGDAQRRERRAERGDLGRRNMSAPPREARGSRGNDHGGGGGGGLSRGVRDRSADSAQASPRSRRGERRRRRSADAGGATDLSAEVARLDALIQRWEADFVRRNGRRAGADDRARSHYFTQTFHKRLEAAKREELEAGRGGGGADAGVGGAVSKGRRRRGSRDRSARPHYPAAPAAHSVAAALPPPASDPAAASGRIVGGASEEASCAAYATLLASRSASALPTGAFERDGMPRDDFDLDADRGFTEMGNGLSAAQLARAVQTFRTHDSDGDGTLEYAEFAAAVRELMGDRGPPIDHLHLRAAFHRLDADHSRAIDFAEYLSLLNGAHSKGGLEGGQAMMSLLYDLEADGLTRDEIQRAAAAFRRHDHDRRGALSPRSFGLVVGKLALADGHRYTESELSGLLRRADLDADGEVDFHELLQLLARQKRVLQAKERVDQARMARAQTAAGTEAEEAERLRRRAVQREEAAARAGPPSQPPVQPGWEATSPSAMEDGVDAGGAAAPVAVVVAPAPPAMAAPVAPAMASADPLRQVAAQAAEEARASEERRAALQASGADLAYANMLRDEVTSSGVLVQLTHLSEEVVEAAIGLYARFETRRDGRMRRDDFVRAMRTYGQVLGQSSAFKTGLLQRAYDSADSTNNGSLNIADFLRYVGRGGVLHVVPAALAAAAGRSLSPGDAAAVGTSEAAQANFYAENASAADDGQVELATDAYAANLRAGLAASGTLGSMPHVLPAHIESCIQFFRAFDADADGHLTPREFVAGLKAYGRAVGNPDAYQRRFLLEVFDAADVSSDAKLELAEFVRFIGKNGAINMEMKAMRRAAAEWIQLRAFQQAQSFQQQAPATGGGIPGLLPSGGMAPLGGSAELPGQRGAQSAFAWQRQQAEQWQRQQRLQAQVQAEQQQQQPQPQQRRGVDQLGSMAAGALGGAMGGARRLLGGGARKANADATCAVDNTLAADVPPGPSVKAVRRDIAEGAAVTAQAAASVGRNVGQAAFSVCAGAADFVCGRGAMDAPAVQRLEARGQRGVVRGPRSAAQSEHASKFATSHFLQGLKSDETSACNQAYEKTSQMADRLVGASGVVGKKTFGNFMGALEAV